MTGGEANHSLRYLRDVMLTTGRRGVIARQEIEPGFFPGTSVLLATALEGARPRIQDVEPACVLEGRASGDCLLATVSRIDESGQPVPLVTLAVAPSATRSAEALWRRLHRISGELATRADQVPAEPWCASRFEPGLFAYPEVATWIGCLRECIAWTWVGYVEDGAWPGMGQS